MSRSDTSAVLQLSKGIRAYKSGDSSAASDAWRRVLEAPALVDRMFAKALIANVDQSDSAGLNLYDGAFTDSAKQIDLFEQIRRLEFVTAAHGMACEIHASNVRDGSVLIDFGIGAGGPTAAILAAGGDKFSRVIGIDIDEQNVARSGAVVRGLDVEYTGVAVGFEDIDWRGIREIIGDAPVHISAAFALHHLTLQGKRGLLAHIESLRPTVVTLIEPSSDHWDADLMTRFLSAYVHFSALGRAIDASSVDAKARDLVLEFFSREVFDIMRDAPDRFERHEHWLFWYRHLLENGLEPLDVAGGSGASAAVSVLPGAFNMLAEGEHLVTLFGFGSVNLPN